jgi:hypothetical protein
MGQSSTRAAMIYMYGSDARQHEMTDTLTSSPGRSYKPAPKRQLAVTAAAVSQQPVADPAVVSEDPREPAGRRPGSIGLAAANEYYLETDDLAAAM